MTSTTSTYTREEIQEHRRVWLDALRSGDFKQAHGLLYDQGEDAYCCLGVACRVAGIPSFKAENIEAVLFGTNDPDTYNSASYLVLPIAGREWLGVVEDNPTIDMPSDLLDPSTVDEDGEGMGMFLDRDVASLNDAGVPFYQIADLIEHFGFEGD